jgi:large subunit ribosomal protein L15
MLEKLFEAGATVDIDALRAKGILPKKAEVIKILGEGDLTKKLTIKTHRISQVAKEKVEKAGGVVEIVE